MPHVKFTATIILSALIVGLVTYQITIDKLMRNNPLSLSDQLSAYDLTLTEQQLQTKILKPTFNEVKLVGVAKTNSCAAYERGCFNDKGFHSPASKGPSISILVYETAQSITSDNLQHLKALLSISPYSLSEDGEASVGPSQIGVQSLFNFTVSAAFGDTEIRVVIRPAN